jgi:hypothetical protein
LISLREIKPSSTGLEPSNALRSCAAYGQLDPTPWGPRALDPPVGKAANSQLVFLLVSPVPMRVGEFMKKTAIITAC